MPVPTVIIAWDAYGLKVEAPGLNGQRQKIEGVSFDDLPALIQAALIEQRDRLSRQPAPVQLAPSINDRPDPQIEREQRIERERQERTERFNKWLDTLPQAERERQIAKRDEKLRRAEEYQREIARNVWYTTADRHGVALANQIIAKERRPNRKIVVATSNGPKLMNLRTEKLTNPPSGKRRASNAPALNIKINL